MMYKDYKHNSRHFKSSMLLKHKGGSTIVLVIILCVAISILSGYGFLNMRSTKAVQNSSASQFYAKGVSWTAVSVFRDYLDSLTQVEFDALRAKTEIEIKIAELGLTLRVTNLKFEDLIDNPGADYQISATFSDISSGLPASKPLSSVFLLENPPPPPTVASSGGTFTGTIEPTTIYLGGDVDITGDHRIIGAAPGGGPVSSIVSTGNVILRGLDFESLKNIYAKGDVFIDSQLENLQDIYTDGDVTLEGGVVVTNIVTSLGNVALVGNAEATTIRAGGDVDSRGRQESTFISAKGRIDIGIPGAGIVGGAANGDQGLLEAVDGVFVHSNIRNIGSIYSLNGAAIGNELLDTVGQISVRGALDCSRATSVSIGYKNVTGSQTGCPSAPTGFTAGSSLMGADNIPVPSNSELTMPIPASPAQMPSFHVNGPIRDEANYILRFTHTGGDEVDVKVTVKNVNGIADGEYEIGESDDHPSRAAALCTTKSAGKCSNPGPHPILCYGGGWTAASGAAARSCFRWDEDENKPLIEARYMLPGIVYVEGDLSIQRPDNNVVPVEGDVARRSKSLRNTILVEGDLVITRLGSATAVNYAGFDEICNLSYWDSNMLPHGDHYPTNLCDMTTGEMKPSSTGNIAVAAGSLPPSGVGYNGGNISLESKGNMYGSVIAGNRFALQGEHTVAGVLIGLAQSKTEGKHTIEDEITYEFKLDTAGSYDPTDLPLEAIDTAAPAPEEQTGGGTAVPTMQNPRVLWSKYH